MPRGGVRNGTPGTAYANRTDLQSVKPLPVRTGPSAVYGDSANLARAQQAVPMAPPPSGVPQSGGGGPSGGSVPAGPPPVDLHAPSDRPNEPVTAGLPVGPGPGPEALGPVMAPTPQTLGDLLGRLAQTNPDVAYLQAQAARGWR
jgi:hypothetical protein